MALDGLKMDGVGGIVDDIAGFGMSPVQLKALDREIQTILARDSDADRQAQYKIAQILVMHLTHDERMCALHAFYQADVAPCSGEKLCRLRKRVLRKLRAVPELESLWHLL